MKRITALIAFSSAIALASAASAQLVGDAVGGATGQVGGAVSGATGSVTGGAGATTRGAVNPAPRVTPPAATSGAGSATTGAAVSREAAATPPAAPASGSTSGEIGASASAQTPAVNANANAAAASTTTTDLTFLKAGQTVKDASGATLGSVNKIERGADGAVSSILVTTADGKKKMLPASSLSITGEAVTTTSAPSDK